jgi:methyl acetate hydrolase
MLLAHTAGFSYSWYNADLHQWVESQNLEYSDKIHVCPLVNEPGTKWDYGMNMDWAGVVLEAASGKSLGEWARGSLTTWETITDRQSTSLIPWD